MIRSIVRVRSHAFCIRRCLINSEAISYSEYGDPEKVLNKITKTLQPFANDEVLIKVCAAPINPADINTIQGVYPIKPQLPAVPGNEGVGKVLACGKNVDSLSVGDLVIPGKLSFGTWQTHWCGKADDFIKIKHSITPLCASLVAVNPCTALHLLSDFVDLQAGDYVIQNGATSAAGIYVIQIAKLLGYKTVNLFRERDSIGATEETRKLLENYGATWAFTESEFVSRSKTSEFRKLGPFKLALNCLGGKPAVNLIKCLDNGGTLVTYGGMTRNPMPVPVGPFIFQDIRLRGFWLSGVCSRQSIQKRSLMIDQVAKWFAEELIKPAPILEIPFENWRTGLSMSLLNDSVPTAVRKKPILIMN